MAYYSIVVIAVKILAYSGLVWAGWKGAIWCESYYQVKSIGAGNRKLDPLLPLLIGKVLKGIVIIFAIFFICELFHLPLTSLVAGLGIGGIAIAMAAKETIANVFGSVSVLLDRPFQIGDWVKIGTIEGHVESMGFRSTRIRTFYDSLIVIPNSTLLTANVDNMGARKYRRIKITLRISYSTPSKKINTLRSEVGRLLKESHLVRQDGFDLVLDDFGPTALDLSIQFFLQVHSGDLEREEKHRILTAILDKVHELSIECPIITGSDSKSEYKTDPNDIPTKVDSYDQPKSDTKPEDHSEPKAE